MPYHRRSLLAALLALGVLTAGCTSDGKITSTLANGIGNPFKGPTEGGFLELVRHYCAPYPIGDSSVGSLLATDPTFKTLTSRLYRGDLSNDAFSLRVLELHPAEDANVPGTGCMINQLGACFARRCEVPQGTPAATVPLPPTENTEDAAMRAPIDDMAMQTASTDPVPLPSEAPAAPEPAADSAPATAASDAGEAAATGATAASSPEPPEPLR